MWMPDDAATPLPSSEGPALGQVHGPPTNQPQPPTIFGGQRPPTILFNVKTTTKQIVRCQFAGTLNAPLNTGEHVKVEGARIKGVLYARRITSMPDGAVIGETRCFVATAAYGDPAAPEVETLRLFRDRVLARSSLGRAFIAIYWRVGPVLARRLAGRPRICWLIRHLILSPLSRAVTIWMRRREANGRLR